MSSNAQSFTGIDSDYAERCFTTARPKEKPWVLTMDYRTVSKNATQFLALTSLHVGEFESLLAQFAPVCEKHFCYHTLEGKKRKIVTAKEHGHALKPWLASPPTRSGGMSIRITARSAVAVGEDANSGSKTWICTGLRSLAVSTQVYYSSDYIRQKNSGWRTLPPI